MLEQPRGIPVMLFIISTSSKIILKEWLNVVYFDISLNTYLFTEMTFMV